MTAIQIIAGLPFVTVTIESNQQIITLDKVLLDSGSMASVFKTDDLEMIGVKASLDDNIHRMTGIGS